MKFCWATINVKDMKESLSFYTGVVGLKVNRQLNPMPGTDIAFLGSGDTEVELIRNERNNNPHYGKDISLGFEVASIESQTAILKENGISAIDGPYQPNPTIKFIYVEDPNGVRIQFVEHA